MVPALPDHDCGGIVLRELEFKWWWETDPRKRPGHCERCGLPRTPEAKLAWQARGR